MKKELISNPLPRTAFRLLNSHVGIIRRLHSLKSFENEQLIVKAIKTGEDLALISAGYKCENPKCRAETDLTIHHLVMRTEKIFCNKAKYFCQRRYFENLLVLCAKCHTKQHPNNDQNEENMLPIPQKRIDGLKASYGVYTDTFEVLE